METTLGRKTRRLSGLLASVVLLTAANGAMGRDFEHAHTRYDALLKAHVDENGMVNYRALMFAPQELDTYLDALAAVTKRQYDTWSEPEQLAFAFNLYNAATLKLIVDHYPVASIRDIGSFFRGPWKQPGVRFRGETITLDDLEHGFLRKQYNEPRLHMALVCAAKGCPPLRREAYVPERLDEQLDNQARAFLRSPKGLRLDCVRNEAHISRIFKWYGNDFTSVPQFVSRHSGQNISGMRIRYLEYDWDLNEQ